MPRYFRKDGKGEIYRTLGSSPVTQKALAGLLCLSMNVKMRGEGTGLFCEEALVGKDAIESGAADTELTGGTELVAAVKVEDVLNVMANDGVERDVTGTRGGMGA